MTDKEGNVPHPPGLLKGFRRAVEDCQLTELDLCTGKFTWEKGKGTKEWIRERLDIAFATSSWWSKFPLCKLQVVHTTRSDRSPFFPYNNNKYSLSTTKKFNFFTLKITCKLAKTSKESVNTKNKPIKIVGPADKAPLLSEKGSDTSESDSQNKPGRKKATGKMLFKRLSKKALAVLSNLSLAIGEMFTIAGLMAIGIYIILFIVCWVYVMNM